MKLLSGALLLMCLTASPACAQSKIFLSATGNDANDGSRLSPKRSFQAAHNSVTAGGNIVVLDTAGYGQLTITKSVAITVPPGVNGFVTVSGFGNGIVIDAGASAVVALQGLIIEGSSPSAIYGVRIVSAKTVTIEDTQIRNFYSAGITTYDLTTDSSLQLRRTSIHDMPGYGVNLAPNAAVNLRAEIVDTSAQNINQAFYVGDRVLAFLTRSEITGGNIGLLAAGGVAFLDACKVSHNSQAFDLFRGGIIYTLGNNAIAFNTTYISGASDLTPLPAR